VDINTRHVFERHFPLKYNSIKTIVERCGHAVVTQSEKNKGWLEKVKILQFSNILIAWDKYRLTNIMYHFILDKLKRIKR
jgi:hypothetical protein